MKKWFQNTAQKNRFIFVNLVWFISPVYFMFFFTGLKMAIGFLILISFIASYLHAFTTKNQKLYMANIAFQIILLAILGYYYNFGYMYLGFYIAIFISRIHKNSLFTLFLAIFSFMIISVFFLDKLNWNDAVSFIGMFLIMIIFSLTFRLSYEKRNLEGKLDQANEKIDDLVMREERSRIARDLHDTLGHTLSLITLKTQLVQKLVEKNPGRAIHEAKEIEETSRVALKQVRELVSNMRSVLIMEEIKEVEAILKLAGIEFIFNQQTELPELQPVRQNMISLCIREAVTNIIKHAQAARCSITVAKEKGELLITIRDDGVGGVSSHSLGNGISGMKERLSFINGRLDINSNQDGTCLHLFVPLVILERKG